jgi:hypothetical protein
MLKFKVKQKKLHLERSLGNHNLGNFVVGGFR